MAMIPKMPTNYQPAFRTRETTTALAWKIVQTKQIEFGSLGSIRRCLRPARSGARLKL